jgi:hypothetical protein
MDVPRFLPHSFTHGIQESGYIMMGNLEYLCHAVEIDSGFSDSGESRFGYPSGICPSFAYGDFDLQPLVEFIFVRPDFFHFGA